MLEACRLCSRCLQCESLAHGCEPRFGAISDGERLLFISSGTRPVFPTVECKFRHGVATDRFLRRHWRGQRRRCIARARSRGGLGCFAVRDVVHLFACEARMGNRNWPVAFNCFHSARVSLSTPPFPSPCWLSKEFMKRSKGGDSAGPSLSAVGNGLHMAKALETLGNQIRSWIPYLRFDNEDRELGHKDICLCISVYIYYIFINRNPNTTTPKSFGCPPTRTAPPQANPQPHLRCACTPPPAQPHPPHPSPSQDQIPTHSNP